MDVILDGALLTGQLLQDLRQHLQGRVDLRQPESAEINSQMIKARRCEV